MSPDLTFVTAFAGNCRFCRADWGEGVELRNGLALLIQRKKAQ